MGLFSKIFPSANTRNIKKLEKIANQIEALDEEYSKKTDLELMKMTGIFKDRLSNGETLDDILVEAYATVREASKRVLNMKHFHVQLLGGIALHQGRIAEMRTGEGKTLVATLPAYLNALEGKGVHIVTVNEYLARRDADWMGKVHKFLGLTVGVNVAGMDEKAKRDAYNCDITYCTNNELGFDYLRDNMVQDLSQKVQRGQHFAIVDEVDSKGNPVKYVVVEGKLRRADGNKIVLDDTVTTFYKPLINSSKKHLEIMNKYNIAC